MTAATPQTLPADAVEVGRVLGAWGAKGAIKVKPYAADPQALYTTRRWFIEPAVDALPGRAALPRTLQVDALREQGEVLVATAQELPDRNAAEAMRGARIFISRSSFPAPDADEFYWVDLIGLAVTNREGQALGTVAGLIETGPHCVLRLDRGDGSGNERLIPFVAAYVDRVDIAGRSIVVDWDANDWDANDRADEA